MPDEPHNRLFSNDDFIEAVRQNAPASTPEVSNSVGCSVETARVRLAELHENGMVDKKTIGGSSVWYID